MADILQKPDRELNMWPYVGSGSGHGGDGLVLVDLERQYDTSQPISFGVKVTDPEFNCGDLYITIRASDSRVVTQSGFFAQCYEVDSPILPVDAEFSKIVDIPGTYTVLVELTNQSQRDTISASGEFTVEQE